MKGNTRPIVVVGVDGTGKSTMCRMLKEGYYMQHFKNHMEKEMWENTAVGRFNHRDLFMYTAPYMLDFLSQVEIPWGVALDRFTPCEYAYSRAFERETLDSLIWDIDRKLAELNATLVLMHAKDFSGYQDELYDVEHNGERIQKFYMEYFERTKMNKILVDARSLSAKTLAFDVMEQHRDWGPQ